MHYNIHHPMDSDIQQVLTNILHNVNVIQTITYGEYHQYMTTSSMVK